VPNICLVWDFDGTLTPDDSTSLVIDTIDARRGSQEFWKFIKSLRGDDRKPKWQHVLAMDAPSWMYALSRIAAAGGIPLNSEFFREFVVDRITLFPNTLHFLKTIKALEDELEYQTVGLRVHHFIVSAGLQDLIQLVFPDGLITYTFGCRYTVISDPDHPDEPESIPAVCMDETTKTRSLFEISKGSFEREDRKVNSRIEEHDLFSPFANIIYIGDGDTDIPALSLVRNKGGAGIVVYNPEKQKLEIEKKLKVMRADKRADCIVPADFSPSGELSHYLINRCRQILYRYKAESFPS